MDGLGFIFVLLFWLTFVAAAIVKIRAAAATGSFFGTAVLVLYGVAIFSASDGLRTLESNDRDALAGVHGDWCARIASRWYTTNITLSNSAHTMHASALCDAPFEITSAMMSQVWAPARAAAAAAGYSDDSHGWTSSAHTHSSSPYFPGHGGGTLNFTMHAPLLSDAQLVEAQKLLRAAALDARCEWVHGQLAPHAHYVVHYTTPICPSLDMPGWTYALWVLLWLATVAPTVDEPITAVHLISFVILYGTWHFNI